MVVFYEALNLPGLLNMLTLMPCVRQRIPSRLVEKCLTNRGCERYVIRRQKWCVVCMPLGSWVIWKIADRSQGISTCEAHVHKHLVNSPPNDKYGKPSFQAQSSCPNLRDPAGRFDKGLLAG